MDDRRCHIWVGWFNDQTELDDYFEEVVPYPEDAPISLFAADQGKRFYDHDLVCGAFDLNGDLGALLDTFRAPAGTRAAVLAAAAAVGFACNAVVVADEEEFLDPLSVTGPPKLAYMGCYPF
jgi:hypothetical protein